MQLGDEAAQLTDFHQEAFALLAAVVQALHGPGQFDLGPVQHFGDPRAVLFGAELQHVADLPAHFDEALGEAAGGLLGLPLRQLDMPLPERQQRGHEPAHGAQVFVSLARLLQGGAIDRLGHAGELAGEEQAPPGTQDGGHGRAQPPGLGQQQGRSQQQQVTTGHPAAWNIRYPR
ncbi:hypothetical protein D9M70_514000 [compost metagenome]